MDIGGQIWTVLRNIIIVIVSVYVLVIIILFLFQSKLLYFPDPKILASPVDIGLAFENIYFITEDGLKLNGWYIPAENAKAAVLFCHGNAGNISHRLESIRLFNSLNLNVFIFDYRGYGRSEGAPSENGTYKDAEAAWNYLTEIGKINPGEIIVFGRSLGGAIAVNLAAENQVGGLIIESSFTSVKDLAGEIYPFFPVRLLSRFEYRTVERIKDVNCPVLIIHSKDDDIIPFHHGKQLFESATNPKEFLIISGDHNQGFWSVGEGYESAIKSFVNKHIQSQ